MNNKDNSEFIFTLSCPDTSGIVAEVAGFMAKSNLTIKESNQFGDSETNSFFMRVKALSINGNDKIPIVTTVAPTIPVDAAIKTPTINIE